MHPVTIRADAAKKRLCLAKRTKEAKGEGDGQDERFVPVEFLVLRLRLSDPTARAERRAPPAERRASQCLNWICLLAFASFFSQSPLCISGSASVPQSFFTISRWGTKGHLDFGF